MNKIYSVAEIEEDGFKRKSTSLWVKQEGKIRTFCFKCECGKLSIVNKKPSQDNKIILDCFWCEKKSLFILK